MSAPKAPQGQFTLLYFASATSYTRKQHDFLPAPLPILGLHDKLEKLYPGIVEKVLRSCAVTVNLDYVDLEEEASKGEKGLVIQPGDEVAIIPPPLNFYIERISADPIWRRVAMTAPTTIVYKTVGNVEIPFDLYLPKDAQNVPVLLWFHGGGLLQSKRTNVSPHMLKAVDKYKIAVISADYRLAPQVGVADIFEDVQDCITFIRHSDGLLKQIDSTAIDAQRLAPKVILPIYPITDPLGTFFTTSQPHPLGGGRTDHATVKSFLDRNGEVVTSNEKNSDREQMYFYMMQEANLAELLRIKPGDDTYRIAKQIYRRRLPPAYCIHGDADRAVGVEQCDEVVGIIYGLNMDVKYERLHGLDHLFDRDAAFELEGMYEYMMKHV
ncbi:hypothetical protein KC356_g443 [Hortaea werneckii]|nr:hypothetical protein KC356_g443 [Hortaea werneckii]